MKNRNKLKRLHWFQIYESEAMGVFLEEMAQKGWKLNRIEGNSFCFEAIEPQKLHYAVEVFAKGSMLDSSPTAAGLEYIAFCREGGWDFVCMTGQRYIFVSKEKAPVPIETDEVAKLNTTIKATFKQNAGSWFVLPLVWLLQILFPLTDSDFFSGSNFTLAFYSFLVLAFAVSGIQAAQFCVWALRQKHRLKKNKHPRQITRKTHTANLVICLLPSGGVAVAAVVIAARSFFEGNWLTGFILGGCFALVLLSVFAGRQMRKARMERKKFILISVLLGLGGAVYLTGFSVFMASVFSAKPPQPAYPIASYTKTVLADEARCTYFFETGGDVYFSFFRSKHRLVITQYLFAKMHWFSGTDYEEIALPEWSAKSVYYSDFFIFLEYEDYVLSFSNHNNVFFEDRQFTSEQIEELKNFARSFEI
ncbi:MAG: DUF2812 domain-containing protein [Oscillospiraceae bacterium]|nr:DUF2812 domain-containing protein [Oscillospiraceae bacterium]